MPGIYQGTCSACGTVTEETGSGYIAVWVDEPAGMWAHPDEPHLAILGHPLEESILEDVGYTFRQAAWSGRLVGVTQVWCCGCGEPFEIRFQADGGSVVGCSGRLGIVGLSAGVGFAVAKLFDWVPAGIGAGAAALFLLSYLVKKLLNRLVRLRHADLAARIATPEECPQCGSREYRDAGALRKPIPCRKCGRRAVTFELMAIS